MSKSAQRGATLQLHALSIEQLRSMKDGMDNDINALGRAYDSIRAARNRFGDSKTYLETFKAYKKDQEMLVPLSSSLYVPGQLTDASKVLVDVGTGYYVQQSVPRAQDFFNKRMGQMKETMDNISEAIQHKQRQQNTIIDVIRQKAQALQGSE
jgi:prefoldin alpha subunit